MTGDERHEEAVRAARRGLGDGDDLQTVLVRLRAAGLGVILCIRVVREVLGVSLGHAKALVHFSPAFADQRAANEALHDSLIDAIYQIEEAESAGRTTPATTSNVRSPICAPAWLSRFGWAGARSDPTA